MNRAAQRARGEEGFTLPELIMAIAILAIIIAPLSLALITGLRVVGKADAEVQRLARLAHLGGLLRQRRLQREHDHEGRGRMRWPGRAHRELRVDRRDAYHASADVDAPASNTVTYAFDSSDPLNQRLLRRVLPQRRRRATVGRGNLAR